MTTPAQDRYFRLVNLRGRFRTATFTASPIPGLKRTTSQDVISRRRHAGLLARRPERLNVLMAHHLAQRLLGGAKNIFDEYEHSGK